MNYQPLQAETYVSGAAMISAYSERRARLMTPTPQPVQVHPKPKRPEIVIVYRDKNPKDAHVRSWEAWKAMQGSPCRNYIKRRCEELGVPYEGIVGSSRFRRHCYPRQLIMWELKTFVKPSISYPELGRLFGGRDHTTALHAVRKIEAQRAKESA